MWESSSSHTSWLFAIGVTLLISIYMNIYIYIYTTSTPPFQSPARCLPLAEGARTGYKPTRRNNDSLQLTWMRQTAQTKKRIVQRETQSEHWQNQFEELQANTAERIKKAVTTVKDNDNKATEQLSQVPKLHAESEIDQLKVAVEMPLSMITGTKCYWWSSLTSRKSLTSIQFKSTVDRKETVLTEREKERLNFYLAGGTRLGGNETTLRGAENHDSQLG